MRRGKKLKIARSANRSRPLRRSEPTVSSIITLGYSPSRAATLLAIHNGNG